MDIHKILPFFKIFDPLLPPSSGGFFNSLTLPDPPACLILPNQIVKFLLKLEESETRMWRGARIRSVGPGQTYQMVKLRHSWCCLGTPANSC
jgi:hypothetical protein